LKPQVIKGYYCLQVFSQKQSAIKVIEKLNVENKIFLCCNGGSTTSMGSYVAILGLDSNRSVGSCSFVPGFKRRTCSYKKLNRSITIFFWTLLSSIALFAIGQILFVTAFKFFEPQVDGILFQITEHSAAVKTSVLFSSTLALIPVLMVLTWRLAHIIELNKKIASALVILIFIVTGIFARHQEVKIYFTTVVKPAVLTNGRTSMTYPIDPVNFVYYIFSGLCIGCIVSYILFKKKRSKI
jgi:hypothetical protein